ncbi:DEAD/DEAH box helicase [Nocardia sp. NPDC051030]|uniref:DEAD/DEAH box helicase n=1 Tax=Nocardia sp. NPDC051030 TaxID=3155162 RepID=UPI003421C535
MPESRAAAAPRFADLGLPPVLVQSLRRNGIETPFPIQTAVIPDILAGHDVLGRAATGSGKTLAFGLPMLVNLRGKPAAPGKPRGLILAPTRELAIQIETALDEPALSQGLRLATAVGGLQIKKQEERLARGVDLLIATPGRLTDLIGRRAADLSEVRVVTIDEADHMAELGFLPQLTAVLNRVPAEAQKLLFSATLDDMIDTLVQRYMRTPVSHAVGPAPVAKAAEAAATGQPGSGTERTTSGETASGAETSAGGTVSAKAAAQSADSARPRSASSSVNAPAITHYALHVRRSDKRMVVAEIAAREGRTLLFVRTQYGADKLVNRLREAGIAAIGLHGGKAQNLRNRTLAAFADGTAPVLVATDIAARGIHIDDVSLVVHVDPPADPKDYLHRAGRTARAGAAGTVVTIVTPDDREEIEQLTRRASITMTDVEVRSGDQRLAEITGARRPSGRPLENPLTPPTPAAAQPDPKSTQTAHRPTPHGQSRKHTKKRGKPDSTRRR